MTLRVAMLSRWHVHANEYANSISQHDNAGLTAIWDEEPARGRKWADELELPFVADLGDLLARDDVDAVCVVTPTNIHREVMVAAADAGKHIFTEKVLATTVADALAIKDAVQKNGIKFCISFPRRTMPQILYAKHAVEQGLLGDVTAIRIRIAHAGASRDWLPAHFYDPLACGGGAMMDLGAHGMYISHWLGGVPKRVVSIFTNTTNKQVEDNAITMIEFESGAIAVNETSFVAYPDSYSLEIDGMKGAIRMLSPREGIEIRSDLIDEKGWHTAVDMPEAHPSPINQWVTACQNGPDTEFGIDEAVDLTRLMEAAYISQSERRSVDL